MSEKTEKASFSDKTAQIIQKNRFILLGLLAAVTIGLIGLLAFTLIQGGIRNSSAKGMDEIRALYEQYQESTEDAKKAEIEASIATAVDALAKKHPSLIAAQEALMLRAGLASVKEDFKTAQEYYFKAYATGKKSFVAPFALKNAALMAENAGDPATAIEYYGILIKEYEEKMPGLSLSYFNLGRLYEGQKDYAKANETFGKMGELFPGDSWTNLAKSRIISMKTQGLVP